MSDVPQIQAGMLLQPVQSVIGIGVFDQPDGSKRVLIRTETATGMHVVFLTAKDAASIATQLADAARQAKGGGIVVATPDIPPDLLKFPPNGKR